MLLANALAADLIAAGTRVEGIHVQPSTDEIAGQGYRVMGDVHVVGTDLQDTIRLEDAAMGAALWAERLDQPQDGAPSLSATTLLTLIAQLDRQVAPQTLVHGSDLRPATASPPSCWNGCEATASSPGVPIRPGWDAPTPTHSINLPRSAKAMPFTFPHSTRQEPLIHVPPIGLELRVRVPSEASGGALTCIETVNAPGFGPPLHRHRETEVFHVIEGRYLFEVNGSRFEARVGDVVVAPGGTAHAFVNVTPLPARQFVQILPGLDASAFFLELGEVMREGGADHNALNAFGKRWCVEFLGPPLQPTSHV